MQLSQPLYVCMYVCVHMNGQLEKPFFQSAHVYAYVCAQKSRILEDDLTAAACIVCTRVNTHTCEYAHVWIRTRVNTQVKKQLVQPLHACTYARVAVMIG